MKVGERESMWIEDWEGWVLVFPFSSLCDLEKVTFPVTEDSPLHMRISQMPYVLQS